MLIVSKLSWLLKVYFFNFLHPLEEVEKDGNSCFCSFAMGDTNRGEINGIPKLIPRVTLNSVLTWKTACALAVLAGQVEQAHRLSLGGLEVF